MITHTPGPWKISDKSVVAEKTSVILASAFSPSALDPRDEQRSANLTLIARAPELLAACQQMCAALHAHHMAGGHIAKPVVDAWCAMTEAVAAAGGAHE